MFIFSNSFICIINLSNGSLFVSDLLVYKIFSLSLRSSLGWQYCWWSFTINGCSLILLILSLKLFLYKLAFFFLNLLFIMQTLFLILVLMNETRGILIFFIFRNINLLCILAIQFIIIIIIILLINFFHCRVYPIKSFIFS